MRLLVLVRAAISSTRAPLNPLPANSSVAMSMILRLVPSGSFTRWRRSLELGRACFMARAACAAWSLSPAAGVDRPSQGRAQRQRVDVVAQGAMRAIAELTDRAAPVDPIEQGRYRSPRAIQWPRRADGGSGRGSEARKLLLLKRCAILTFSQACAPTWRKLAAGHGHSWHQSQVRVGRMAVRRPETRPGLRLTPRAIRGAPSRCA